MTSQAGVPSAAHPAAPVGEFAAGLPQLVLPGVPLTRRLVT
jgi:hypothetical protein